MLNNRNGLTNGGRVSNDHPGLLAVFGRDEVDAHSSDYGEGVYLSVPAVWVDSGRT